jgi:hypothetical protein
MGTIGVPEMRPCKFQTLDFRWPLLVAKVKYRYIFQIWQSLIAGAAIDEQRASVTKQNTTSHEASTEPDDASGRHVPAAEQGSDSEDENFDPNNIQAPDVPQQGRGAGEDESDTDYGSDY